MRKGGVGLTPKEIKSIKDDEAVRLIADLDKVSGGFRLLRRSIDQHLQVTRPYLDAAQRRAEADRLTTETMNKATKIAKGEKDALELRNVASQATKRSQDIDQLISLRANSRRLQERAAMGDTVAEDLLNNQILPALRAKARTVANNEGLDKSVLQGPAPLGRRLLGLLEGRQSEYATQASSGEARATAIEEAIARRRQQFSGLSVGILQGANGATGLRFGGPDNVLGAGVLPPQRGQKGTLATTIEQRVRDEFKRVDPTGKGKNLSEDLKQALINKETLRVQQEYVKTVTLQIMDKLKIRDKEAAQAIAMDRYTKSLENGAQVIARNGRIQDKALADAGARGGFGSQMRVGMDSIRGQLAHAFSSHSGFVGGQMALGVVATGLEALSGKAEDAVKNNNELGYKISKAGSGAGVGMASGAMIGFSAGPVGAAVGAVVGGLYGLVNALNQAAADIGQAKIDRALEETVKVLNNFAKGTVDLTPDRINKLRQNQSTVEVESSAKSQRDSSFMGFGLFYRQDAFQNALLKNLQEANSKQVTQMMDALGKIIDDEAKGNIGKVNMEDRAARERSFNEALSRQGGIGRSLLGRIAATTEQDPVLFQRKLLEGFMRTQDNEFATRQMAKTETEVNRSAASFSNLSSAVEIASQHLARLGGSVRNLSDLMEGTVSGYTGTGLAETFQRPYAAPDEFVASVKGLTGLIGGGKEVEGQAQAIALTGRMLPGIINAVRSQPVANISRGADISIQIADRLREALNARGVDAAATSSMVGLVQSQIGTEDFSKMLKESGQDMGKLIQKIMEPVAGPLKESFGNIAKSLDERAKVFAEGLADLANRTRATGELMDKAMSSRMGAVRNALDLAVRRRGMSETAADNINLMMGLQYQQARQSRLTGVAGPNAENPEYIAQRLNAVFDQVTKAEQRVENASRGGSIPEQNAAALQLATLKNRAADLGTALKNLGDVSERNAAIQERLGKIQADREGRQALGMRYATANAEGRAEIARSFQLLTAAGRLGTAAPFGVREQNQIFSLLSSLSPQMSLKGLGGISVKELTKQLMTTTFGGAFDLDPQTAALERTLENMGQKNYEVAARAAELQVELQQRLQSDFFTKLSANQDAFLVSLSKAMADNARMMAETLRGQAASRLTDLEKQVGDASMLGKLGIKDDAQFNALKNATLNGEEVKNIFAEGRKISQLQSTTSSLDKNAGKFAADLITAAGGRMAGSFQDAFAGSVLSLLGEAGFTNKDDQKKLLTEFQSKLQFRANNGTLAQNGPAIEASIRAAVEKFSKERIGQSNETIKKNQDELLNKGMLQKDVISNLIKAAKDSSGDLSLTTIENSLKSVDTTGKKFSELNAALDEARNQVKKFADQAAAAAPGGMAAGGPVRFFNKGGWGSGGSSTPHPSDTVNARIAPDEFVVASGPARKNRALLERMNRGGLIGFADGGMAEEAQANLDMSQGFLGQPKDMINPDKAFKLREDAIRFARLNAEILFMAQLKNLKGDERDRIVAEQSKLIEEAKGDKSPQQEGVLAAIKAIKEIDARQEEFRKNHPVPALSDLLEYHAFARMDPIGQALDNPGFAIEDEIYQVIQFAKRRVEDGRAARQNRQKLDGGRTKLRSTLENAPELKNQFGWLNDDLTLTQKVFNDKEFNNLFEYFGKPKVVGQELYGYASGRAGTRQRIMDELIAKYQKEMGLLEYAWLPISLGTSNYNRHKFVARNNEVDKHIIDTVYKGHVEGTLSDWYARTMDRLIVKGTKEGFAKNVLEYYEAQHTKFDKDKSVADAIDKAAAHLKAKKDEMEAFSKSKNEFDRIQQARTTAFMPPADRVKQIVSGIKAEEFGVDQLKEVQFAQIQDRQAKTFNRLNPAQQSLLIQQAKTKILENKLSKGEQAQLDSMGLGKALAMTSDVSPDEIKAFAANKSRMTALQRAALEIFMENLFPEADLKKKVAGGEAVSDAERIAYLMKADADGRSAALSRLENPKARAGLIRMGQFLQMNPEMIDSRLEDAKKKGVAAYAEEAALMEFLALQFGLSKAIPKATEAFGSEATLPKFASGGLVPGVGNTDSVRANLPVGSYVIRKSSVNSIGADNLHAMGQFASGGVVPAMVMPGEYIFGPQQAAAIGHGRLDSMNKTGRVAFNGGGLAGMPKPNPGMRWIQVPVNFDQQWGQMRNPQRMVMAMPVPQKENPFQNPALANAQAAQEAAMADNSANLMAEYGNDITKMKSDYYVLLADLRRRRQSFMFLRPQEKAEFQQQRQRLAQLHAALTDPQIVRMDQERQIAGIQGAVADFAADPQAFLNQLAQARKNLYDRKNDHATRLSAQEQIVRMSYAARMVDQNALRQNVIEYRKRAAANQRLIAQKQREDAAAAANNEPAAAAANNVPAAAGVDMTNPANAFHIRAAAAPRPGVNPNNPVNAFHIKAAETAAEAASPVGVPIDYSNPLNLYHATKDEVVKNIIGNDLGMSKTKTALDERMIQQWKAETARKEAEQAQSEKDQYQHSKVWGLGKVEDYSVKSKLEERYPGGYQPPKPQPIAAPSSLTPKDYNTFDDDIASIERKRIAREQANAEKLRKLKEESDKIKRPNIVPFSTRLRQIGGETPMTKTGIRFANGGIVPGTGSRDTVPALLTPGEMVIPKHEVKRFAAGGVVGGTSGSFADVMDAANRFNQAAAQIGQGLSGFSTSVNAFGESVGTFGEFVARFDEAVGKIPEEITLSGVDGVSVNITGQESIVRAVTEALGPMIAEAIRNSQPVEQRSS